jgi:hypothetical protein
VLNNQTLIFTFEELAELVVIEYSESRLGRTSKHGINDTRLFKFNKKDHSLLIIYHIDGDGLSI